MPFHQKVNTDARLTRMIEDMGITLNPRRPDESKKEEKKADQKGNNQENE